MQVYRPYPHPPVKRRFLPLLAPAAGGGTITVSATLATVVMAPQSASVSVGTTIQATLSTMVATGLDASVVATITVNATLGQVGIATLSATVGVVTSGPQNTWPDDVKDSGRTWIDDNGERTWGSPVRRSRTWGSTVDKNKNL